jgi:hypothetical protein
MSDELKEQVDLTLLILGANASSSEVCSAVNENLELTFNSIIKIFCYLADIRART